ncbi:hypothetical protein [Bacillus sp. SJS]|uniref:hypothetical protein n=1 Tax=Bacillus sp. SJS TaxID=1423321 RepID=UPI0004DD3714|nr:hypothetical protein [Bacillus sp. SJS]KZZ86239.1 hypothetical protein AS29_001295 [Bacillus sp. SJS]
MKTVEELLNSIQDLPTEEREKLLDQLLDLNGKNDNKKQEDLLSRIENLEKDTQHLSGKAGKHEMNLYSVKDIIESMKSDIEFLTQKSGSNEREIFIIKRLVKYNNSQ